MSPTPSPLTVLRLWAAQGRIPVSLYNGLCCTTLVLPHLILYSSRSLDRSHMLHLSHVYSTYSVCSVADPVCY